MSPVMRVPVKAELLSWACERSRVPEDALAKKFPKLGEWQAGALSPTLKQLEKFAKATHTPVGYFFLPEPPEEALPIPDFRTLADEQVARPSPNLLDTVYAMQRRQDWLRETLLEGGEDALTLVASARLGDSPLAVASEMRRTIGMADGWAKSVSTWEKAVSVLRSRIEELGVMAVINGVVGNNTHRVLEVEEFRGFAMSDPYAPLIFVNGADAKSAQMFTLAHELAHIWLGEAGLSGFEALMPHGTKVEDWCNKVAAEFLVPERELRMSWPKNRNANEPFEAIAREFKVSPIVAARRVLDLLLISREEFFSFYKSYTSAEREMASKRKGGGDFYNNQNTRVGSLFARHVYGAAAEGRLGFKEAYDLTGLKGGTFQDYAARLGISF